MVDCRRSRRNYLIASLAFNLLGDGLRDVLEPNMTDSRLSINNLCVDYPESRSSTMSVLH